MTIISCAKTLNIIVIAKERSDCGRLDSPSPFRRAYARHLPRLIGGVYSREGGKNSRHSERSEESHDQSEAHMLRTFSVGYFACAQYDVKAQAGYFVYAQYDVLLLSIGVF